MVSTQQVQFSAASTACVGYQGGVNTITVTCDASFLDVVQAISDPAILEQEVQGGQYILHANLEVADGVTFQMTSNGDNLQYLKLASANGMIVYGQILIDGVKITSWDVSEGDIIQQDMNGTISRGYIQFAGSEGAQILNSEFGYLGYDEPGRRGFDLYGGGGPSHDMVIRGSTFHDMWFAFYSNAAYNIVVDGSEYHHNIRYALDPHTATYNMNITNNYLHHNRYGAICSDDCYNILIEGNRAHHNTDAGIVFSRNMTNSIARNNHVYNATTGISVSESSNNQIYNNTIESAADEGILLFNPEVVDDGFTEGNIVYDNVISSSEDGIRATNSHDNILENNTFDDIELNEYRLSLNSNILIRAQNFDEALIAVGDLATQNLVEIVDSGVIQVTQGANEQEEEEDGNDNDEEEEEETETTSYNTDIQSYTRRMSGGESIMVNSYNKS
ncbi:MAG: right-handed parallel beta-helix repeat-containing protein [Thermoproteota archaeon]|nr:right-handed parallel beta-helix repeat-containing protein [Thermoproteota archaeon]